MRGVHRRAFRGGEWTLAVCGGCGQYFTSPTPSEAELEGFYAGDYHAALRRAGGAEGAFGEKYRRYVETLGRHLKSGRIMDVGCGTGLLVRMLRDGGYDAEGVELNAESAAWGRQHYGVRIHSRALERCGFAARSLDAVLMTDVLEHTRHPGEFLRGVARLVRPGGVVFVTFPDIASVESRYQRMLARALRREWLWGTCHVPLHVWEFTRATAEACFRSAGFRVAEFRRSQPAAEPAPTLLLRLLGWPSRVLTWRALASRLGTQMEFVIQKTRDLSDTEAVAAGRGDADAACPDARPDDDEAHPDRGRVPVAATAGAQCAERAGDGVHHS